MVIDKTPLRRYTFPVKDPQRGDYGVMVAQRFVVPLAWVRFPLVTPLRVFLL